MDSQIYGRSIFFLIVFAIASLSTSTSSALPNNPQPKSHSPTSSSSSTKAAAATTTAQINSNSVLVALLDSHYTELAELVEKALLLQTLEEAVGKHNITIFAPKNEALERQLDPEFKRFLLEPGNLKSLQTLLMFHIIPNRIGSTQWPHPGSGRHHQTLCSSHEHLHLATHKNHSRKSVNSAQIIRPDDVTRPDGVIHGIERLLIPRSVEDDFNRRRNLRTISAILPEGAPEVDPRTHRLKKPHRFQPGLHQFYPFTML
ncbi:hypothetical protein Pyn_02778 [Prunus yedoensis var. nudiflora]|uniref:FAS1 domain-containing protein n=1 Tax=Prunus yedoensis var. nudiflora TaxID=2094558 RepID=A0A314YGT6_PRUYE|nr:hypothetical protein Pyn_02778 [Prunus yedoensis var. nudiflora]